MFILLPFAIAAILILFVIGISMLLDKGSKKAYPSERGNGNNHSKNSQKKVSHPSNNSYPSANHASHGNSQRSTPDNKKGGQTGFKEQNHNGKVNTSSISTTTQKATPQKPLTPKPAASAEPSGVGPNNKENVRPAEVKTDVNEGSGKENNKSNPAPVPQPAFKQRKADIFPISTKRHELLSCSVQGASHIAIGKECQDYSRCWYDGETSICIVSDGHGGDRYFRSKIGAEKATQITYDTITRFVAEAQTAEALIGKSFKAFGIRSERNIQNEEEQELVSMFDQLFRSIISQWHSMIEEDAKYNPLSEWENDNVKQEYRIQLEKLQDIEKIYGCTLIAYVQTASFWFAFQIGDGKCVAFDVNGKRSSEPIPWDEQCFLNKTTSLCGSHASEEFRFCCQGDGNFPCAVFMGSDGMDDTFRTERALSDFYVKLGKYAVENGSEETAREMESVLPTLSKRGSQDDMSVAYVINRDRFKDFLPELMKDQLQNLEKEIRDIEKELADLNKKATELSSKGKMSSSEQINLQYCLKDIETKHSELSTLKGRKEKVNEELIRISK